MDTPKQIRIYPEPYRFSEQYVYRFENPDGSQPGKWIEGGYGNTKDEVLYKAIAVLGQPPVRIIEEAGR